MKCIYCQGTMRRGAALYHIDRNGYHLLFDRVPAWVCSQCGEAYFEEQEAEEIQEAIREMDQHAIKLIPG